jgi:nicotinamidase-related amidase
MTECLILIDLQNDYFEGGNNPLVGSLEAVHNAKKLLDDFRKKEKHICHIRHLNLKPGSTYFLRNTFGSEIHEIVKPEKDELIVTKFFPNSFLKTEFSDFLKSNSIDSVVIAGMMTHMCVDATTRAAFDSGYKCTVVYDACATKDLEIYGKKISSVDVHNSFMAAFQRIYADVLTTNECLDS